MPDMSVLRKNMVRHQIAARGVSDERVLDAMRVVPREAFMPDELGEFAYEDTPLPIEEGQTISQPYIVALMIAAIEPRPDARVLEIGTGSGYAAAVLSRVVGHVYTVERHEALVDLARRRFRTLGYGNVEVLHGDGSLGWPEHAPYDAIIVTAGGPHVPRQLRDQLAVGGRMVIPIGADPRLQQLVRVTRVTRDRFEEEQLGDVRFVPLVGADAWGEPGVLPVGTAPRRGTRTGRDRGAHSRGGRADRRHRRRGSRPPPRSDRFLEDRPARRGEPRHLRVLPDARPHHAGADRDSAASRSSPPRPTGPMPRGSIATFATVPRCRRESRPSAAFRPGCGGMPRCTTSSSGCDPGTRSVSDPARRAGFYGLDLYSLFTSIAAVLRYLDDVDPDTAALARRRYACLTPWERDPAVYGRAALTGRYRTCEEPVTRMLRDMMERRLEYTRARRRALPGCDPERAAGGRCGALLPGDVLRPGGFVEPA